MSVHPETTHLEERLELRRHRHWYDRLMMLCDGVFAIAITLLAADIRVPDHWNGAWDTLWPSLARQLDAYSLSCLVIAVYWLAHRRFMGVILKVDPPVTVLTLVMLCLVALLPAASRLISGYGRDSVAREAYAALVVAIGLVMSALWAHAALVAKDVHQEIGVRERWFFLLLMVLTPPALLAVVMAMKLSVPGLNTIILAGLFLVGWRLRLWTARRLRHRGRA